MANEKVGAERAIAFRPDSKEVLVDNYAMRFGKSRFLFGDVYRQNAVFVFRFDCFFVDVADVVTPRYRVTAEDDAGPIGQGTHERFLIMADKFLAKAEAKKG